jgi:hypothetical protein
VSSKISKDTKQLVGNFAAQNQKGLHVQMFIAHISRGLSSSCAVRYKISVNYSVTCSAYLAMLAFPPPRFVYIMLKVHFRRAVSSAHDFLFAHLIKAHWARYNIPTDKKKTCKMGNLFRSVRRDIIHI